MINIDIQKTFGKADVGIDLKIKLNIKEHTFLAVSGKSGSGKTTFLRILAGLQKANGSITVKEEEWLGEKCFCPPQNRNIGFVFQDYALFDNMTVEQNLLFVKKDKKLSSHLLKLTQLESLKDRYTGTLSGGQQQRVAICRALMNQPKLLLMDEPLSALDPEMRVKLQDDILRLHNEFGTTTVMVTHDPSEMYRLASRVVVLQNGRIIKDATPKEILLNRDTSEKFSFEGKLLDIIRADVINVAVISIGQQIVEVVLSMDEVKNLKIGSNVTISTKAFSPVVLQDWK